MRSIAIVCINKSQLTINWRLSWLMGF